MPKKQGPKRPRAFVPLFNPVALPALIPDLLAVKEHEISRLKGEQQVLIKLEQFFWDTDMRKALALTDEEAGLAYLLVERLCNQEEARILDALATLEEQRQRLMEMQERLQQHGS
jgi:hypothetical protein